MADNLNDAVKLEVNEVENQSVIPSKEVTEAKKSIGEEKEGAFGFGGELKDLTLEAKHFEGRDGGKGNVLKVDEHKLMQEKSEKQGRGDTGNLEINELQESLCLDRGEGSDQQHEEYTSNGEIKQENSFGCDRWEPSEEVSHNGYTNIKEQDLGLGCGTRNLSKEQNVYVGKITKVDVGQAQEKQKTDYMNTVDNEFMQTLMCPEEIVKVQNTEGMDRGEGSHSSIETEDMDRSEGGHFPIETQEAVFECRAGCSPGEVQYSENVDAEGSNASAETDEEETPTSEVQHNVNVNGGHAEQQVEARKYKMKKDAASVTKEMQEGISTIDKDVGKLRQQFLEMQANYFKSRGNFEKLKEALRRRTGNQNLFRLN